jgi:hypothetical protein
MQSLLDKVLSFHSKQKEKRYLVGIRSIGYSYLFYTKESLRGTKSTAEGKQTVRQEAKTISCPNAPPMQHSIGYSM